jgi:hypothetical protein
MHIEFLCISKVAAENHLYLGPKWLCQPEIGCTILHFFQINAPRITLTLHCSSTMVGGHEKQSDSNTTATSSSASAWAVCEDWDIAPPLQNVRVDTQYVGIIEEQKQQIKQLPEELAEFNCGWYRTLPANASKGKNVLRSSKKVSMTPTDHINQQTVASYVREAIWPGNKMLTKSWSKWRDGKQSLCQMILKKVVLPLGVDGKSYWEAMILGITNDKFYSLRANFKQDLFKQFQGKLYSI